MTIQEIQKIIKDFESSTLMSLELQMEGFKLKLSKNKFDEPSIETNTKETTKHMVDEPKTKHNDNAQNVIKSPLVGTFYASSSPQGKPFVEVGQTIKKGQVVCIIEAMKIMNEITATQSGVIKEIVPKNGDVVGFNQPIIRLSDHHEK